MELATCEILDNISLEIARDALHMDIPKDVNCQLFMGIDGHKSAVQEQIKQDRSYLRGGRGAREPAGRTIL